ncbi:uncharacterized protein LOC119261291 [Talpa occidentalis]|uniref:uncharacterized protein LOC119261291 n=1 Tax=Talpa occidentalis TaxID=50954 RepID=UPI0023F7465D|nr:uncharacterized protein LOC119261291 [Talpa occidentalis]
MAGASGPSFPSSQPRGAVLALPGSPISLALPSPPLPESLARRLTLSKGSWHVAPNLTEGLRTGGAASPNRHPAESTFYKLDFAKVPKLQKRPRTVQGPPCSFTGLQPPVTRAETFFYTREAQPFLRPSETLLCSQPFSRTQQGFPLEDRFLLPPPPIQHAPITPPQSCFSAERKRRCATLPNPLRTRRRLRQITSPCLPVATLAQQQTHLRRRPEPPWTRSHSGRWTQVYWALACSWHHPVLPEGLNNLAKETRPVNGGERLDPGGLAPALLCSFQVPESKPGPEDGGSRWSGHCLIKRKAGKQEQINSSSNNRITSSTKISITSFLGWKICGYSFIFERGGGWDHLHCFRDDLHDKPARLAKTASARSGTGQSERRAGRFQMSKLHSCRHLAQMLKRPSEQRSCLYLIPDPINRQDAVLI